MTTTGNDAAQPWHRPHLQSIILCSHLPPRISGFLSFSYHLPDATGSRSNAESGIEAELRKLQEGQGENKPVSSFY